MSNEEYIKILREVRATIEANIASSNIYTCRLLEQYAREHDKIEGLILRDWLQLILDKDAETGNAMLNIVETAYNLKWGTEANIKRIQLIDEMIEVLGKIPKHRLIDRHVLLKRLFVLAIKSKEI